MRIIAFINQKGGVGKTTSVFNIGAYLHSIDKKVLLIDCDPQAGLTSSAGLQFQDARSLYEVFKGLHISEIWFDRDGLFIVPSNAVLAGAEIEYASMEEGRDFLLKEALANIDEYEFDFILLDCPPSLGILTINALTVASEVIIPVQPEFLSLLGMKNLTQTITNIKNSVNENLEISGVIFTRYSDRKLLNQEVMKNIKKHFPDKVFSTFIRECIKVAEAPAQGKTIFEHSPHSNGADDYKNLTKEIIEVEVLA